MLPEELPFYFKVHTQKGNGGYPESFPFHVYYDDHLSIYRQRTNEKLNQMLREVYAFGELVEGSLSTDSGKIYLDKLVSYIDEQAGIKDRNILEVGCGSGILLKELRQKHAAVTGVEPGAYERCEGTEGINIVRDFFPSPAIEGKFDVIVHFAIMEHIDDPVDFLVQQKNHLNPGGKIIISVPNCEPFLEAGDISIFIHEHLSYFTREGVKNVINNAGLYVQHIHIFEGVIMACASVDKKNEWQKNQQNTFSKEKFESEISVLNKSVKDLFAEYNDNEIAVYVPVRAMNALFLANLVNCRLIDDNAQVTGKYVPCFNNPIENFEDVKKNPPACILIYSRTFGHRIKDKCLNEPALRSTKILTLDELE